MKIIKILIVVFFVAEIFSTGCKIRLNSFSYYKKETNGPIEYPTKIIFQNDTIKFEYPNQKVGWARIISVNNDKIIYRDLLSELSIISKENDLESNARKLSILNIDGKPLQTYKVFFIKNLDTIKVFHKKLFSDSSLILSKAIDFDYFFISDGRNVKTKILNENKFSSLVVKTNFYNSFPEIPVNVIDTVLLIRKKRIFIINEEYCRIRK